MGIGSENILSLFCRSDHCMAGRLAGFCRNCVGRNRSWDLGSSSLKSLRAGDPILHIKINFDL